MGDVKDDWDHWNVVNGSKCDGNEGGKDGAMSIPHCNSKWVKTDVLAGYQGGQHQQHQHTMSDIPRPPTPLPDHHKQSQTYPNPPCHRGRLKTQAKVSVTADGPTRSHRRVKAESSGLDGLDTMYMAWRWSRNHPRARYAKMRPLELTENTHTPWQHNHR